MGEDKIWNISWLSSFLLLLLFTSFIQTFYPRLRSSPNRLSFLFRLDALWVSEQKYIYKSKVKRENQQDANNSMFIIKLLSQHVSGIITPIIRRIRPCFSACGVLPGCVGCGWLWCCGAASWAVCTVWRLLSRTVTSTQCTRLTMQLHKTTTIHSLHTQEEHRMQ